MSDKPEIGKYKHSRLTTDTRSELDKVTAAIEELVDVVRSLEKAGVKNTNGINQAIIRLIRHHARAVKHVNAIWELIKAQGSQPDIETQLTAINDRLEAHDEVIRLVRQLIQEREQAEQLFGESTK